MNFSLLKKPCVWWSIASMMLAVTVAGIPGYPPLVSSTSSLHTYLVYLQAVMTGVGSMLMVGMIGSKQATDNKLPLPEEKKASGG